MCVGCGRLRALSRKPAHNADGSVQLFRDTDALTCGLLPGFSVPVASLFVGG